MRTNLGSAQGIPTIRLGVEDVAPIAAYVGPDHTQSFLDAGVELYTFYTPGQWWIGPDAYSFDALDAYLAQYIERIPGGYFMPRINLASEGASWWGKVHSGEMVVLRNAESGQVMDPLASDPRTPAYLGHDVRLESLNLHSFHSQVWRDDAARAVEALISHCEAQPYANRIWAWHLCDGLFCEWFHWHEYTFTGLADYSAAALADFRRWLGAMYGDDAALSRAWGRNVSLETADLPTPQERLKPSHGEFYDPVQDRPTIDYMQCMSDATADSIISVCEAAKRALPEPKLTCIFYGYQFSNMPRAQLNAHYALRKVLDSPAVDMLASPHSYSNRGEGGYHSPQSMAEAIRRAGKIHFDEIDCKTVWTPDSVTWKRHISQPTTVSGTIEMMKKDAAYQLATGTAQWWMDLTNQAWFDAPEAVEPIRRLRGIEENLQDVDRSTNAEVALVVSQRSMMFQAPNEGLHNATQMLFRNWHLSRMGAPFDQVLADEIGSTDLPRYRLYIMANTFYLSSAERERIHQALKRDGAAVLWVYAPGYLDDHSASLANITSLTGITVGMSDIEAELDVKLNRFDHPLTQGLDGLSYGTGIDREQYLAPPKTQYLPETQISPAFYADDPDALVLGVAASTGKPGLVVKELDGYTAVYSAAPVLSWQVLRNLACWAGVHLYGDQGDMVWANRAFLCFYAQSAGRRVVALPRTCDVYDAYESRLLARSTDQIELDMAQWETRLLLLQ